MRLFPVLPFLAVALSIPAFAGPVSDKIPDQQAIDALEQRASQAQPREQPFLYAQLVHDMVEVSAHQYAAGNVDGAHSLLKRAQEFTHKIHLALARNDKKLKDAQIILRHTAFRLRELLHSSTFDEQPLVEETLAQLNQTETEAMLQVFRK